MPDLLGFGARERSSLPSRKTEVWQLRKFDGGLNTAASDRLLKPEESPDLENVEFGPSGALHRRKGYQPYGDGSSVSSDEPEFLTRWDVDRFVTIDDVGDVHVWTNGSPSVAGATVMTTPRQHGAYSFNGFLYLHNQSDGGVRVDASPSTTNISGHPKAKYSAVLRDRAFVGNIKESGLNFFSRIRFSTVGDAETWNQNNDNDFIDVVPDDIEEITGLEVVADRLVIFKENSIYLLAGHTRDNFQIVPISVQRGGCPYPDTIVRAPEGVYFASDDGIYRFDGKQLEYLSVKVDPIPGKPLSATYANRKYYLLVNENGTKRIYVYHADFEWWTRWSGIAVKQLVTDYEVDVGKSSNRLVYGLEDSRGRILQLEKGSHDDGSNIDAYWTSGWQDLGIPEVKKRTRRVYITSQHASEPIALEVYRDWNDDYARKVILTRTEGRKHKLRRTTAAGIVRALRFRFENTNGGDLDLDQLTVTFFPRRLR